MTMIHTSDDLLALLRENREFREAVRQTILTEELLALPAAFSAFATEVRADIKRLEEGQRTHTNDIGELKGIGLETKLYNRGPSLVATLLKTRRNERIRAAEHDSNSEEFNEKIYTAQDAGLITDSEYERVLDTDTIIRSVKQEVSEDIYTAVESSYSVTREDIRKVRKTASVLTKLFPDTEIHSALYYMKIAPFIKEEAEQQGVHLIKAKNLT